MSNLALKCTKEPKADDADMHIEPRYRPPIRNGRAGYPGPPPPFGKQAVRPGATVSPLALYEFDPDLIRLYRGLAISLAIAVVAIGMAGLVAWSFDLMVLARIDARWVAMKVNTAVGLVGLGGGLIISMSASRNVHAAAQLFAAFVIATGLATLAEYATGANFGIDQLLFLEPPGAVVTRYPGRMALVTGICLVLSSFSLLLYSKKWSSWLASTLVAPVAFVAMLAILGDIFGAEEISTYAGNLTEVAPTAVALLLFAMSILFATIENSFLFSLAGVHSGGFMLRRLLPLAVLLPPFIVWLRLVGQAHGLFSTIEFGAASVGVAMIASATGALLWCAALLDRLDRQRLIGEAEVAQLNVTLADQVRSLRVANEELQGFSYATSHVMGGPLRAMDGFSRILVEDYADKLDDEVKRILEVIRSNAVEVRELTDGILAFLRLGHDELSPAVVDMNREVGLALEALEQKMRGRKIDIKISTLPEAYCDDAMVRRVWTNLLDNAVKFSGSKAVARIEIGAMPGKGETIYFVRDDGAGFDMQFSGKLFGVFSRLHGSEFPGNGMGLAIVQRIVNRHGGRVWGEGTVNQGATFYFSLPQLETGNG